MNSTNISRFRPLRAKAWIGVREAIVARLPEGPAYFPADHLTDQPERFLAAELIREQILRHTRQEVPHSVAVLIDALGRSAENHQDRSHHLRGTGRTKGHHYRRRRRGAQENRNAWRALKSKSSRA